MCSFSLKQCCKIKKFAYIKTKKTKKYFGLGKHFFLSSQHLNIQKI